MCAAVLAGCFQVFRMNTNAKYFSFFLKVLYTSTAITGQVFVGLIKNVQNEKSRQIRTLQKEIESYRSTNLRLTRKNERLQRKIRFYEMEFESRGISMEYETFEDIQEDEIDLRQSAAETAVATRPPRNLADEGGNQGYLTSNAQAAIVEGQLSFQTW